MEGQRKNFISLAIRSRNKTNFLAKAKSLKRVALPFEDMDLSGMRNLKSESTLRLITDTKGIN